MNRLPFAALADPTPIPSQAGDLGNTLLDASYTVTTSAGLGEGFQIPGGLVVTAAHVVGDAQTVTLNATPPSTFSTTAKVVWVDKAADIALLRPQEPLPGASLPLRTTEGVAPGSTVYTVGSPLGAGTLSRGELVSASDQTGKIVARIPIDHGNSGGPLVDADGAVIGVVIQMSTGGEGLAYAAPVSAVQRAVDSLSGDSASPQPTSTTAAVSTYPDPFVLNGWEVSFGLMSGVLGLAIAVTLWRMRWSRRRRGPRLVVKLD